MDPFIHIPKFRVVVCSTCKYACVANNVENHLTRYHTSLQLGYRKKITKAIQQLNVFKTPQSLADFQFPSPTANPLPFLRPPKLNRFACQDQDCSYIAHSLGQIQNHCRDIHS